MNIDDLETEIIVDDFAMISKEVEEKEINETQEG